MYYRHHHFGWWEHELFPALYELPGLFGLLFSRIISPALWNSPHIHVLNSFPPKICEDPSVEVPGSLSPHLSPSLPASFTRRSLSPFPSPSLPPSLPRPRPHSAASSSCLASPNSDICPLNSVKLLGYLWESCPWASAGNRPWPVSWGDQKASPHWSAVPCASQVYMACCPMSENRLHICCLAFCLFMVQDQSYRVKPLQHILNFFFTCHNSSFTCFNPPFPAQISSYIDLFVQFVIIYQALLSWCVPFSVYVNFNKT